jgi:hypothetical protein
MFAQVTTPRPGRPPRLSPQPCHPSGHRRMALGASGPPVRSMALPIAPLSGVRRGGSQDQDPGEIVAPGAASRGGVRGESDGRRHRRRPDGMDDARRGGEAHRLCWLSQITAPGVEPEDDGEVSAAEPPGAPDSPRQSFLYLRAHGSRPCCGVPR